MNEIELPGLPIGKDCYEVMSWDDIRARDLEVARCVLEAAAIWYNDEGREYCRSDVAAELRNLEFAHHD